MQKPQGIAVELNSQWLPPRDPQFGLQNENHLLRSDVESRHVPPDGQQNQHPVPQSQETECSFVSQSETEINILHNQLPTIQQGLASAHHAHVEKDKELQSLRQDLQAQLDYVLRESTNRITGLQMEADIRLAEQRELEIHCTELLRKEQTLVRDKAALEKQLVDLQLSFDQQAIQFQSNLQAQLGEHRRYYMFQLSQLTQSHHQLQTQVTSQTASYEAKLQSLRQSYNLSLSNVDSMSKVIADKSLVISAKDRLILDWQSKHQTANETIQKLTLELKESKSALENLQTQIGRSETSLEDSSRIWRVGCIPRPQLTRQELNHICSICLEFIGDTDDISDGDLSAHTCDQQEFPHIFHSSCLRKACHSLGFQCPVCNCQLRNGLRLDFIAINP